MKSGPMNDGPVSDGPINKLWCYERW